MTSLRTVACLSLCAAALGGRPALACAPAEARTVAASPVPIDLAICLDTSGSMQGLIDAARQKIWDVVNDLALAKPTPDLRVALLTFGNNGHAAENGWVHVQTDFTTDLDLVSERLFALTTNGGEEYVGRVIDKAIGQLAWHPSEGALKLIVVAGNESADQDPLIAFRDASRAAIARGVMVNSIYCGDPADALAPAWREVATLADGKFAAIDQQNGTIVITTPFDDDLAGLSTAINATYVSFSGDGRAAQENQVAQDNNAEAMNSSAVASRAQTKGCSTVYRCGWDLVDACRGGTVKLEEVEAGQLPEEMRALSIEERRAFLDGKAAARAEIQAQIAELGQKRQAFIAEEMTKQAGDASLSFGHVLRAAVREQASAKGFAFPAESAAAVAPEAGEQAGG